MLINQSGLAHVTVGWNVRLLPDLISEPLSRVFSYKVLMVYLRLKARGPSTNPTVVRDGAIGTPSETPAEQAAREALARRVADKNALNGRTL